MRQGQATFRAVLVEQTATGFAAFATNPFGAIDVGNYSTPSCTDLDGDGDLDLVVGLNAGTLPACVEHVVRELGVSERSKRTLTDRGRS